MFAPKYFNFIFAPAFKECQSLGEVAQLVRAQDS